LGPTGRLTESKRIENLKVVRLRGHYLKKKKEGGERKKDGCVATAMDVDCATEGKVDPLKGNGVYHQIVAAFERKGGKKKGEVVSGAFIRRGAGGLPLGNTLVPCRSSDMNKGKALGKKEEETSRKDWEPPKLTVLAEKVRLRSKLIRLLLDTGNGVPKSD